MKAVEFVGQTTVLGPPPGWDNSRNGPCGGLPVMAHGGRLLSCWRPSAEELEMLNAGGHVVLAVVGEMHPPVSVNVAKVEELP
jgi:hypothetical protein